MKRQVFLRLFWKEYRLQRALWISMALLAAFFLLLIHLFALNSTERYCWQSLAGLTLPAFYCLGCGAALFAGEREGGTYEFQRSLPVKAKTVFAAKFSFALASGATMFVLAGLMLMLLHPGTELNPTDLANRYALGIAKRIPLLGLEMLLWATFFSLLLRRVLVAAILGVLVGSINFDFSRGWYSQLWGEGLWISLELAVMTALVILADVWFGVNWFREKRDKRMRPPVMDIAAGAMVPTDMLFHPSRTAAIARLVWQHWRESGRLAMILLGTTILPLLVIGIEWLAGKDFVGTPGIAFRDGERYINDPLVFFFGFFPAFLGVSLLGLTAFHSDQWGRGYRFLADRGVSPKCVWMSRQLVCWGSVAVTLPSLLVAIFLFVILPVNHAGGMTSTIWLFMVICGWVIGYAILSVSVGQFFSMFLRSGVLAGVFSIITTLVLAAWCWLMWIWQINWLWSMLPIPIALLLATWLRTPDWLVERNSFRAWLRPGLVLMIPAIALLTAVPLYRVYQIPLVDPGLSLEEYAREMTSEERATVDQYEQAIQKLETSRKEALLLAIEASRGKLFDANNTVSRDAGYIGLAKSLIDSATEYEREGKLDEALERYFAALRIASARQFSLARSAGFR